MNKVDDLKLDYIISELKNLDYGSLVITVHEGEITQIDTTEKKRFSLTKSNKLNRTKY
ncbi:YezD family protein [Peribacillus asahii]|uniref:YezD family protein n=1 Tax=Peribacillus asahii TaxID=228899 RepID=UPI00207AE0F8|nr:YezD family protein [Peribacillus asahii]USK58414.1 YezD family protein [Peribacillus asahii]